MDVRPRPVLGPTWRALRVAEHVLTGTLLALAASLSRRAGRDPNWVPAATRWWHQRLCDCLQIKIESDGSPQSGALLVANHISWLDIPAVGALGRITFLSKDEVRRWPVVGALAKAAGTLFITRGGNQAAAVMEQIGERIDAGASVMIFAEGTTSDGHSCGDFTPAHSRRRKRPNAHSSRSRSATAATPSRTPWRRSSATIRWWPTCSACCDTPASRCGSVPAANR
jgi:1-acyl-sn-glycerol-3-phosphate acyltransferase